MAIEISEKMLQPGVLTEWASAVVYKNDLSDEQKEISEVIDEGVRKIGETGHDPNHEIASLIKKAFTPETVSAPSELIGRMFDESSIGEFDDTYVEVDPENTMHVYEAVTGGNVPASYIEHNFVKPTWCTLQAETYINMSDMRRGGYHTVAKHIELINEAFENKRVAMFINKINDMITADMAGYIAETGALPTEASADALALYLHDKVVDGEVFMFMLNRYRQGMSKLAQAQRWPTEADKNMYNRDGFLNAYAGVPMLGFSGQKRLPDGSLIVPDKTVFGVAGKIGQAITRGEARVLEQEDINSEKVHLKVSGYTFGYAITDLSKVGKIVMAQ